LPKSPVYHSFGLLVWLVNFRKAQNIAHIKTDNPEALPYSCHNSRLAVKKNLRIGRQERAYTELAGIGPELTQLLK
jgi:hypothetical protein